MCRHAPQSARVLTDSSSILDRMSSGPAEADSESPDALARICTASDVAAQYQQHHQSLRHVAQRFFDGRRPEDADDAVMAVIVHLLKLADDQKLTDKGESWGAYLRRAVRHSCVDIIRAETRNQKRSRAEQLEQGRVVDADPLGDGVVADDQARRRRARLVGALATLDEDQLAIVKHAFWDGWSHKRIGEALGTTGQAVGQRLKTVLKKLHEEVTRDE
jgi:RNA polymerase sigma factor (sigma-70 family)